MKRRKTPGRRPRVRRRISSTGKRKPTKTTKRSADLLQKTFDSMTDAVFVLDVKQPVPTILECNHAASVIFGYDKREMLGRTTAFLHVSNKSLTEFQSLLRSAAGQGRLPLHVSGFRMKRKDGSVFSSEHSVTELPNEKGERTICVSIVRDITERVRMEEEIKSLARFPSENPNPVLRLDKDGRVLNANEASKALLQEWGCQVRKAAPKFWRDLATEALSTGLGKDVETQLGSKTYLFSLKPIMKTGYVNVYGRDITERKKAEEELRKSEEQYRLLIERQREGLTIVDLEERFVFCNSAGEEMFGVPRGTLVGRNFREFTSPETFEFIRKQTERRRRGESSTYEVEIIRADCEKRQLLVAATPWMDKDGRIVGALAIYRDETERRKSEEGLRRSGQFVETILENANVSFDALDENANVVVWNKGAELMTGYTREEVLGHAKIWKWLYPDAEYRKSVTDRVADVMRRGRLDQDLETAIRRKDGQVRIISWNQRNLLDEHGRVAGSIAIGRDVTDHRRMEEELRRYSAHLEELVAERSGKLAESEKRFRELADLLPQIVYEIDVKGNFTYLNRVAFLSTGYTQEDVDRGLKALQVFVPEDRLRVEENIRRLLSGEKLGGNEYTVLRKDGTTFPVIIHSTAIMRDGKAAGLRGIAIDMTEQKQMEEDLLRSQRMAAMGEAAAMVGHDLRNPLTGIAGAAYYLKKNLTPGADEKAREMLDLIENDVEYASKIMSDLQEYSGEIRLNLTETGARSVAEQALALVEIPSSVQVSNLAEDEPKTMLDVEKMRRVFVNLIGNAVEAMPTGGKLVIRSEESNGSVKTVFSDTGTGITEDRMTRLWRPFNTTKAKGMGLGLPIARRIVEAHGGSVSVESQPGKGTNVTVTLPIKPKAQ